MLVSLFVLLCDNLLAEVCWANTHAATESKKIQSLQFM